MLCCLKIELHDHMMYKLLLIRIKQNSLNTIKVFYNSKNCNNTLRLVNKEGMCCSHAQQTTIFRSMYIDFWDIKNVLKGKNIS